VCAGRPTTRTDRLSHVLRGDGQQLVAKRCAAVGRTPASAPSKSSRPPLNRAPGRRVSAASAAKIRSETPRKSPLSLSLRSLCTAVACRPSAPPPPLLFCARPRDAGTWTKSQHCRRHRQPGRFFFLLLLIFSWGGVDRPVSRAGEHVAESRARATRSRAGWPPMRGPVRHEGSLRR